MGIKTSLNLYSISLDISTTNVGIALWDESGKLVELKHLELTVDKETIPSEDRYIYKADLFKDYIILYKERILLDYDAKIDNVFVEAPLSNTPKNINTTAMLLGFNGIACYKLYEILGVVPKLISVYDVRKIFCSEFVRVEKKRNGTIKETLSFPKGWKNDEKKEFIRQKVSQLEPQINWFYTRNNTIKDTSYDMSDAYACGYAGLKVLEIIE